jgi:hypothetical protein
MEPAFLGPARQRRTPDGIAPGLAQVLADLAPADLLLARESRTLHPLGVDVALVVGQGRRSEAKGLGFDLDLVSSRKSWMLESIAGHLGLAAKGGNDGARGDS